MIRGTLSRLAFVQIAHQDFRYTLVRVSDFVAQFGIIQIGIFLDFQDQWLIGFSMHKCHKLKHQISEIQNFPNAQKKTQIFVDEKTPAAVSEDAINKEDYLLRWWWWAGKCHFSFSFQIFVNFKKSCTGLGGIWAKIRFHCWVLLRLKSIAILLLSLHRRRMKLKGSFWKVALSPFMWVKKISSLLL